MADTQISLDELDARAKVMLTIWELTKDAGFKFVSPQEIADYLNVEPGYIRKVIGDIEAMPSPHLSKKKYHAPGKKFGRRRIGYRLDDDAVIKEGTALILLELLKSHHNHSVRRDDFVLRMVTTYQMTADGVNGRIDEAIRANYVEDLTSFDGTIRGRERVNLFFDYISGLASKYRPASSPQDPAQAVSKGTKKKRAERT